jgi:hypothetical protein
MASTDGKPGQPDEELDRLDNWAEGLQAKVLRYQAAQEQLKSYG